MNEENREIIKIRLTLNPKDDGPIYDYFIKLKSSLGLKAYTEVLRFCIKRTYDSEMENK